MRQAQARKISDAYLHAPKRSERHLQVVAEDAIADERAARVVEDLRIEAPAVDIPDWAPSFDESDFAPSVDRRDFAPSVDTPDWAEPFADARWDERLGSPDYEERNGRRTVLVTGRPEGKAVPRRDATPAKSARVRRHTPTRARLAGRPDRVALWAVALGLLMAAMAGFSGNGHGHSSQGPAGPAPAPLLSR